MIILSLGKKGSGKSALLRKLCYRELEKPGATLFFYHDPQCALAVPGDHIFESVDAWRACKHVPKLSVFRLVDVNDLAHLAFTVKDVTLILDELDRAAIDKHWIAGGPRENDGTRISWVRRIVHEGRHPRVNLWGTFRRTQNVPEDLLSQADFVFLFRHSGQAVYDLQMIDRRLGPEYAQKAVSLGFGEFLIASDD